MSEVWANPRHDPHRGKQSRTIHRQQSTRRKMTSISLNEAQAALKAKMESYGEGHVFQYATDGLELHTLCKQLSAVDMDRQKELFKKVICAAETGSRFEGASIEAVNNPNALTSTEEEVKNVWYDNYYTALSQGKLGLLILAWVSTDQKENTA